MTDHEGNDGWKPISNVSFETSLSSVDDRKAKRKLAEQTTMTILASYPQKEKIDEIYIARLIDLIETYPSHVQVSLASPKVGIAAQCKFLPTVAEIVDFVEGPAKYKHSDGTMQREPEMFDHGPNFTQQRLAREAAGIDDDPRELKTGEERAAFVESVTGRKFKNGRLQPLEEVPRWLTHPDPNAWWRKDDGPSEELKALIAKHEADPIRWT